MKVRSTAKAVNEDGVTEGSSDEHGVIRFDEPVNLRSGDWIEVTFAFLLDDAS